MHPTWQLQSIHHRLVECLLLGHWISIVLVEPEGGVSLWVFSLLHWSTINGTRHNFKSNKRDAVVSGNNFAYASKYGSDNWFFVRYQQFRNIQIFHGWTWTSHQTTTRKQTLVANTNHNFSWIHNVCKLFSKITFLNLTVVIYVGIDQIFRLIAWRNYSGVTIFLLWLCTFIARCELQCLQSNSPRPFR